MYQYYYDYEICCFKREMSAPKRLIDSKAWCLLSFFLKHHHHIRNTRQKHEEYHKIKELSEKENTEGAQKLEID